MYGPVVICYDGELSFNKCDDWDWFVIEKKNHQPDDFYFNDGEDSFAFISSARIGDADIEGSSHEMLELAKSILSKKDYSKKRCAIKFVHCPMKKKSIPRVYFYSPRNSMVWAAVRETEAIRLAHEILEVLGVAK